MDNRRIQLVVGCWIEAVILVSALAGCASWPRGASPSGLHSELGGRPHDQPTIQQASHRQPEADLLDPLATDAGRGSSIDRFQVGVQTFLRSTYDGFVGFVNSAHKRAWDEWAVSHLQDGDIVFFQGSGNYVLGFIDFSKLSRRVTESDFTHVGLVAIEEGRAYVYDIDQPGPGRIPFGTMIASPHVRAFAIKRLRPDRWHAIAPALTYCRTVHQSKLPFDKKLKLGNNRLYCAEMIELAYRSGGQPLSYPIRWSDLPRIGEYPLEVRLLRMLLGARLTDRVILPGNDRFGIWSSPDLGLVLPLTDAAELPVRDTERSSAPMPSS